MTNSKHFCDKPLKPWFILIICIVSFMIIWTVLQKEDPSLKFRAENEDTAPVRRNTPLPKGTPVFPDPIQPAALTTSHSPAPFLDGISKATPHGGFQYVGNPSYNGFQNSLNDSVNSILPSVCDIHATWMRRPKLTKRNQNQQNIQFLPPFNGVIDKFIENKGFENIGAGILVDKRGYVLTNSHVVLDATNIVVTVPGNPSKDFTAVTVAHDTKNDLALLKINANGVVFPEARLGDSSFTHLGDYVIAVGSPFGMEQTVTSGIISGIRKSVNIDNVRYNNLFQTDAPINRGSSGGPLVNLSGEVIGVTTAIYAPTGVFSGTGFVIPINDAKEFLASNTGRRYSIALDRRGMFNDQLQNNNTPFNEPLPVQFGIEAVSLDPIMAKNFGALEKYGILVNRVFDETPASFASIKRGDIITSIAGVPVRGVGDVSGIVSHFKSGDKINVRIFRNGKTDELLIRLW